VKVHRSNKILKSVDLSAFYMAMTWWLNEILGSWIFRSFQFWYNSDISISSIYQFSVFPFLCCQPRSALQVNVVSLLLHLVNLGSVLFFSPFDMNHMIVVVLQWKNSSICTSYVVPKIYISMAFYSDSRCGII